jgi:hypothetical protein
MKHFNNNQTMKKLAKCLPFVLLLLGCGGGKTYTIEVHNQSAKRFDSVQVFIEAGSGKQPVVNFGPLLPGQAMPPLAIGELLGGYHREALGKAIFYAADTVIRGYGPYNEGAPLYKHYKMTIDSSLQVKWAEWN